MEESFYIAERIGGIGTVQVSGLSCAVALESEEESTVRNKGLKLPEIFRERGLAVWRR